MIYFETEKVELKKVLNESFEREVVAFLNTHDGTIYIGVEDNGNIYGVEKIDDTMKKISDIISESILPNPQDLISIKALIVNNKFIIEVTVKKGKGLYYISKYGRSSKGCYIRVGTSCRSMSKEQIDKRYIDSVNLPKYSLIEDQSPRQDLTFRIFKIYLDSYNINYNDENFNENNNLLTTDNKYNYQAYLLSDQCDLSFKVAKWEGDTKLSNYLFKKEFGRCSLLKAMDDLSSYIESTQNEVRSFFDQGKTNRRDEFLIDFNAFREGWINACLHNDYSTHLGPAVYLFNDHLEIFSYGSPLAVQSKENFLNGVSKPINPELASIFMKIDKSEESGKGINTIVDKYGTDVFEFGNDYLVIRMPYNKRVLKEDRKDNVHQKSDIELIADLVKTSSKVTLKDMANAIGKTVKTVQRIIKRSNKIKYVGSSKTGHWEII